MTDTATVETLTAEVRCLMIGGRQVTAGVFRQLDWTEPHDIEPFGRVAQSVCSSRLYVIAVGRSRTNGRLVRSHLDKDDPAAQHLPLIVLAGLR